MVLGSPIGAPEFVEAVLRERLAEERVFLEEIPQLPDLQCAWLLLLLCAALRSNGAAPRSIQPRSADDAASACSHVLPRRG